MYETVYTGENITKSDPLYISGSQGANPVVYKADAANPAKMPVTYIASETIAAGNTTRGIVLGLIEGIDLTGYVAGTEVYVAAGGGWTSTRPTGSAIVQVLGVVTKEGAGGKGLILNPGPVNLPNLAQGNVWLGNASGVPVAVTGSSLYVDNAVSASYALSSSFAQTAGTAVTASNISMSLTGVDANHFLVLVPGLGVQAPVTDAGIVYNPSTNVLRGTNAQFITKLEVTGTLGVNGSTGINGSLNVTNGITGSLLGTASYASQALSSSYALTASFVTLAQTASYVVNALTASYVVTALTASSIAALNQAVTITGSINGNVTSASIASNTSSLDFSLGNFYTSLVSGSTNFNITNPKPGQTVNVLLTSVGTGASASFSSNVKQVSGSAYAPTPTDGAQDILTFISWDGSSVYLANVKNLI